MSDYQRHVENCSTHRIPSNYCDYGGPRSGHSQTVAVARMVSGTESGRRRLSPGTPAPTHRPRKRRPALREDPHHKPLPLVRRSKKKAWRVIILIYMSAFCLCWPDFVWNKSSAHVCIFSKPGQPFHRRPTMQTFFIDTHRRHSSQTPITDTHHTPTIQTTFIDPYHRHPSQTPITDTHHRHPSHTPITDTHRRPTIQTAFIDPYHRTLYRPLHRPLHRPSSHLYIFNRAQYVSDIGCTDSTDP